MKFPTVTSPDQEWINWYLSLKEEHGASAAREAFLKYWQRAGSDRANTAKLRSFMRDEGINIEGGTLGSIADTFVETDKSIGKIGKSFYLAALIVAILLVVVTIRIVK
ncbi:MAG: hypothetical protein KatS3mg101_1157 [Patescibacteria group bacterium]|nr:MAG: hypothetical protein KatS3mg101_1157 [Patescibacteria group bacterium]